MLGDRGYTSIEKEEPETIIAANPQNERLLLFFVIDPKVSVKIMKNIKDIIENDENFTSLILIYKNSITSFAKNFIMSDIDLHVQSFSEKELCFNITKHKLVPKHRKLSSSEKNEIRKQYRTPFRNYPLLMHIDPVSRYYGFLPGDLIEITRNSPTAGIYVSYRYVV